jgi:hypothetical protein
MNRNLFKYYSFIIALFSLVSLEMRAAETQTNEVALSFNTALASGTGTTASSTVGDITFTFSGSNVSYSSDHVTLDSGDVVKVAQVSGSGSTITGITFYIYGDVSSQASLSLNSNTGTFSSNAWSGSASTVAFKNSNSKKTVSIQAIVVKYAKSSTVSFAAQEKSYALTDLFVASGQGNLATSTTSGATITYSVLNQKVAQTYPSGYLRFVNDGWTTVSGSDGTNTAYYVAHITTQEIDPTDYVSGNVLDMSSITTEGEISATSVKLPYMTIGIGSPTETAVLKNLGTKDSPRMGMVCLDISGFNHAQLNTNPPSMGTYFTFTPLTNGKLTVKGYFFANNSTKNANAQLYLNDGSAVSGTTITYNASGYQSLSNVALEAGKTYYLYVPTTDGTYDYFCPNYISFVSDFYFSTKSVKVTNGTTSYDLQKPNGVTSSTTYSAVAKGALTNASVDASTGKVSWSVDNTKGDGGAIVVTASDNGSSDFYVITVPYTTHTWSFIPTTSDANIPNWTKMQSNTSDWQFYYKVRQYTDRTLTYLSGPYVSNATGFDGINAYYMEETAGLLIKADAQAFGTDATTITNEPSSNDEKLRMPYTQVSAVTKLTLQEGSTLTIPNLKKGYYVRMRWLRYSSQNGDLVKVSNLNDLDGTEITKVFRVGSRQGGSTKKGYQEFIVKADGDVTFTLQTEGTNKGYVDIEEIAVSNDFLDTDLKITPTTYYYPNKIETKLNLGSSGNSSSLGVKYSVSSSKKEGSDDFAYSMADDGLTLTVTKGQGILTATAKAYTVKDSKISDTQDIGSYVLDEATAPITVLAQATTSQTYPYTWDFKKYDRSHFSAMTTTSGSTSDLWTADNSENKTQYTLNRNSWDCVSGDELRDANGQAVAEAQGLGFTATRGSSSTLVYRTGDDIKFDGADADILHIPTVPTGATVYMLIKVNTGGTVTVDGNPLSGTDVATTISSDVQGALGIKGQTNWKLYTIAGADKTIDVALTNVQLRMVAVTDIFKTFNHLEGMDKSYATEYRDQAERYELSELFTNGASPVTAHIVSAVSDNLATASEVAVAPKYTGVILSTSNQAAPTNVPLFVSDINTSATSLPTNYLKGVLSDSTITPSGANVNYIFTPYYYKVNESGAATTGQQAGTLAFYRQLSNDNTTLGAHKAYLQIPQSASSKQYIFISSIANGDLPSAIRIAQDVPGDDEVYYTLGGQRLQRQPVRSGVYIRNGKKIIVKQK